jgi:rhamnosyltransferase subunit B
VLATWGSFGDLHPYLALGIELRRRGWQAEIATSGNYRAKVEGEGLGFHALRPEIPGGEVEPALMARIMDSRRGSEVVIRELLAPHVREQYEDLLEATRGAAALVTHAIVYPGPLVAEKLGLPWVSTILQPMLFASRYDPPIPPHTPELAAVWRLGPSLNGMLLRLAKRGMRSWTRPIDALRRAEGLRAAADPVFADHFSPQLNLALFSPLLGPPQPDWPPTRIAGFPFYDRREAGAGLAPEVASFLAAGPPPLVFTLGSSAVVIGGDFYRQAVEIAARLERRAVLLVGKDEWNRLPPLPAGVLACAYAPHGDLFPRAAAVIHQGGVGTTGQALRAGRPQLVVPFAHDQPDNAVRVTRLGVGAWIHRRRFSTERAVRELRRLLHDPEVSDRARRVGEQVRAEDGVGGACDAIEALLGR